MGTNLGKYKRENFDVLSKPNKKPLGRKSKGLTERYNINFTKQESDILQSLHEENGAPISTIIRRHLIKSGIFDTA